MFKYNCLKGFLELPNGIPTNDPFRRIISSIDPEEFDQCLRKWVGAIVKLGHRCKAIRGSSDLENEKSVMRMVSRMGR